MQKTTTVLKKEKVGKKLEVDEEFERDILRSLEDIKKGRVRLVR